MNGCLLVLVFLRIAVGVYMYVVQDTGEISIYNPSVKEAHTEGAGKRKPAGTTAK